MDNKGFFNFSSGCAINLDDIGDFPDYHQISQKLQSDFESGKIQASTSKTFLDADLQDVQHISNFLPLMRNFIKHENQLSDELRNLLQILLLKFIMCYFTSYSVEDDQAKDIIQYLKSALKKQNKQKLIIQFLLGLSLMAAYSEQFHKIVDFFITIVNEENIQKDQLQCKKYIKIVDKLLRYRNYRHQFQEIFDKNKQKQSTEKQFSILAFKLSLWNQPKHSAKILENIVHLNDSDNKFLSEWITKWKNSVQA